MTDTKNRVPTAQHKLLRRDGKNAVRQTLTPLVTLAAVALLITLAIPWFNSCRCGRCDMHNLYLEVWEYDQTRLRGLLR